MRTLFHYPLCPFSRKVRIALAEKKLEYEDRIELYWERREEFVLLNPSGDVPVLVDANGATLADSTAICEYLEETHRDPPLLPAEADNRAEVRRLVGWFDVKFHGDVTRNLVEEKVIKRMSPAKGAPDSKAIRAGFANIHQHLEYIAWLTERRTWLAGPQYSLADVAASAQISCLDYIGDVPWDRHPGAKDWYARVKSRPSFRSLLSDHLPGVPPPKHYADLDF